MNRISKRQQAINSIEEELTKESSKKRKQDTRRKILLGAYLISKMRADPNLEQKVMAELEQFLDKEIDRQLFGFS
ncbi:MAG: mobilization protein [Cyanobacteria bacterium P01_A01_bin.40]